MQKIQILDKDTCPHSIVVLDCLETDIECDFTAEAGMLVFFSECPGKKIPFSRENWILKIEVKTPLKNPGEYIISKVQDNHFYTSLSMPPTPVGDCAVFYRVFDLRMGTTIKITQAEYRPFHSVAIYYSALGRQQDHKPLYEKEFTHPKNTIGEKYLIHPLAPAPHGN